MEVASYRMGGLIVLKTLSDVASRLSSFLLLLLAARFLDPFEFGLFSLAWATGWIISIASDLGLQLFVSREVARSPEKAGQFVPTLFRLRLSLGSILFGVIGLAHWMLWWDKGGAIFLGLVLVQLLSSVIEFFNHLFEGLGEAISNRGPICFTGWAPCWRADLCLPPVPVLLFCLSHCFPWGPSSRY